MKYWFTADEHFGHENIIKYCNRPFKTVAEMDIEMVKKFNSVVLDDDITYHLGDFTLKNKDFAKIYIENLNGKHIFIKGSHDYWIEEYFKKFVDYSLEEKARINPLRTLLEEDFKKIHIVMCHYPMLSWPRSFHGSIQLFGHEHGKIKGLKNQMDVGVDTNNFYPYSLDDIVKKLKIVL